MTRILLIAVCLPLLGGLALFEHYSLTRQRLQLGADFAAKGGAHALAEGRDIEPAVRRRFAEAEVLRPGDRIEIEHPPGLGRFRGWKRAVRVRVGRFWSPPLLPRSLTGLLPLDVAATAVAVPPGPGHPQPVVLRVE